MSKMIKNLMFCAGVSLLTGCGGGTSSPPVTIANQAPVAQAGVDQSVFEQEVVTLAGIASDSDGSIASFQWSQTTGASVDLSGEKTDTASFTAPDVGKNETSCVKRPL